VSAAVAERRTEPVFPSVAQGKGHYESFYVRACHPSEPLGIWIRHTVHKRPGERPKASVWFALFEPDGPSASKVTTDDLEAPGDGYVRIGDSSIAPGTLTGSAPSDRLKPTWQLAYDDGAPAFRHLPRGWMYRAPVPRTKTLSPHPSTTFSGTVTVGDRDIALDRWPGMVGHNWGAEHAERWIWTDGLAFDGRDGAYFDAAIGRIKVGPLTTPWIGNACLALDGELHRLGGPKAIRATTVTETPTRAEFTLPGDGITVKGTVEAPRERFVGWVYADPDGPEHNTVNCSIATMELTVERPGKPPATLRTEHGATYELGMRETDHGIPVQPFSDG
jgi:hypothetical protein